MEFVEYTIAELALQIKTGKTPPTSNPLYFNEKINWLTPSDLSGQKYVEKSERTISDLALEEKKAFLFKSGTVIISTIGNIGKACIIDKPSASNQQLTGVVLNEEIITSELFYYWVILNKKLLNNKANKAIISMLSNKLIKKLTVKFPESFEEQFKIVSKLNKIQDLIDKRIKTINLLDEYINSSFLEMFLDNPDSNKWKLEIINETEIINKTIQGIGRKSNIEENGIPFLRMNNITSNGEIDLKDLKWIKPTEKELITFKLSNRNILFNRTNSPDLVGKIAVWDKGDGYTFAGYLVRIDLDETLMNPYYFSSYFNSEYGKKVLKNKARISGNLANVSATRLKKQKILIPPIDLQNQYENIYLKIKSQKEKYNQSLDILEILFQSSLQDSFNEDSEIDEEKIFEDILQNLTIDDFKKGKRIEYLLNLLKKDKKKGDFSNSEKYNIALEKLLLLLEDGSIEQYLEKGNIKLKKSL